MKNKKDERFFRNFSALCADKIAEKIPFSRNFAGFAGNSYRVDITNVFYRVVPFIWITPRYAYACVGGSNVQYSVTVTNIPQGVNWTLIPDLSGSGGAVILTNADWHYAQVTPGNVGTNYKVWATSKDNTNFYDQVDLTVVNVDIEETNVYLAVSNTVTLHLTPDSSTKVQWQIIPSVQNGAFIQGSSVGTSIVFNSGSIPTNYTVRAYAEDLTNCYDTCTVTVIKVEIEKCVSSFLPQGGTNDNTTTIRAFVTPNTVKGKLKFTLFDVSDEKGYCLNAPTNLPASGEDSDAWKDFQFPSQAGFTISGADGNIAETVSHNVSEATATIKSYDYGSFGKIKAEFITEDNSFSCVAREVNGTNEYTRLPADVNGNDIADSWSGDTGPGTSQGALDDLDNSPAGDGVPGDHLSRYQEYRGFMVQGTHVRTDPAQKDVFCRNYNIPAAGLSGFLTTENLGAPVHPIRVDEWENDTTRRINPMSETHALSPDLQTAILVEDINRWRDTLGQTLSGAALGKTDVVLTDQPLVPNNLLYCVVDVNKIRTDGTKVFEDVTPNTNIIFAFSTDGFRTNGTIKIDDEIILYSNITAYTFTGCIRGAMDTTQASHAFGAAVLSFVNANEVIQSVFGHEAGHVIELEHYDGPDNNIMNPTIDRGSQLNYGYWNTYAPALPGEFRVKP